MSRASSPLVGSLSICLLLGTIGASCDSSDGNPDAGAPSGDMSRVGGNGTPDMAVSTGNDDMSANSGPAPLIVDSHYAASGYFGSSGDMPGASIAEDTACPMRGGQGRGKCHHFLWTPGVNVSGGVFWQSPANNWGDKPGYALDPGYTQVRFFAWGPVGGETITFISGLNTATDHYQSKVDLVLTTTPTEYVLGVRNAYAGAVVSAFGWSTGAKAAQGFFIDDIALGSDDTAASTSFDLATKFGATGYFGDGSLGLVKADNVCTPPAGGSADCLHFTWDPAGTDDGGTTQHYAGVFWQSAPNNWAGASDPPGAAIAAGPREIRFWAWSAAGGEHMSFLAGYGANTRDGFQSTSVVTLTTTPTLYSVGVGGAYGANVTAGFGWVVNDTDAPGGSSFYVDGAQWR